MSGAIGLAVRPRVRPKADATHGQRRLMLRDPHSLYVGKRHKSLLKVKTFYDAEARVVDYEPGKVSKYRA